LQWRVTHFANPLYELRDTFSKRLISRSRLRRDSA
jgi:hypothetical protein